MSDPFFANVSLLVHCDGTNGSTTFVDSSSLAQTITALGTAQISTTSPKFGTGALAITTGRLTVPGTNFAFGTSDFTIEGWAIAASFASDMFLFSGETSGNLRGPYIKNGAGNVIQADGVTSGGSPILGLADGGVTVLPTNTWFHWAMTRSGNDWYLFVDGALVSTVNTAGTMPTPTTISIGGALSNIQPWVGRIDDVRVTIGTARYTSSFTPPAAEFEDASSGFLASGASTSTGSATLSVGRAVLAGVGSAVAAGAGILTIQGQLLATGRASASGSGALTLGRAILSASGQASSSGLGSFTAGPSLQAAASQTMDVFAPYAHMNGGGTEPVDPYYNLVVLLLHMDWTNASVVIPDASKTHKWVRGFGSNAQIGVTGSALAGSAVLGVTDGGLRVDHPTDFDFGSGDFCVEGWAKTSSPSATMVLYQGLVSGDGSTSAGPSVSLGSGALACRSVDTSGTTFGNTSGGSIPNNTWFHWAYTRTGTSFQLWLNGTQVGSTITSSSTCKAAGSVIIGNGFVGGGLGAQFVGTLDEVRSTKGAARYTATFTPIAALWPDSGSFATLSVAGAQTIPPFAQVVTVFGAGQRSAAAAQTLPDFPQVYLVSGPSRVVQSSTTFVFGQVATVITTADRNLTTPGDAYFNKVAYLLHGDSSTSSGGLNHELDNSKNNWNVSGSLVTSVSTDALAFGGKAITFAAASGSAIWQTTYDITVPTLDRRLHTTEMRVRFDTLTGVIMGTPDPSNPGQYTFDPTLQQTGWFFSSGNGGGAIRIGLAGGNGAYPADWTSIALFGSSIDFSPYVLQIKGFADIFGVSTPINQFGVLPVTPGWHNITVERSAVGTVNVYLDGVFDFNFSLSDPDAQFIDETFIAGADTTRGFAFNPAHTNLSAIEEMRHTWGVNRYGSAFTPTTVAFPDITLGLLPPIAQVATVTTGAVVRVVSGAQTMPAFGQAASCFGAGPRSAAAAQTIPDFGQVATVYGQGSRALGATQFMAPFGQLATVSPPRALEAFAQHMDPVGQVATVTTTRTVAGAQNLTMGQSATAIHATDGLVGAQTLAIGQVATAKALLALTAGQILPAFGQSAQASTINKVQGAQTLDPFIPSTLIEGAFTPTSARGYLVRPENRTQKT